MINQVSDLINSRLNNGESSVVSTPLLTLNIGKSISNNMSSVSQGMGQVSLPSFCDLVNSQPLIINASNPTYTPPADPTACNSRPLTTVVSRVLFFEFLINKNIYKLPQN